MTGSRAPTSRVSPPPPGGKNPWRYHQATTSAGLPVATGGAPGPTGRAEDQGTRMEVEMDLPYRLDDVAWARIAPLLPDGRHGARRVDDRRVVSGIVHVIRAGLPWQGCPAAYGPWSTIYNRYRRWCVSGVWQPIGAALIDAGVFDAFAATSPSAGSRSTAGDAT